MIEELVEEARIWTYNRKILHLRESEAIQDPFLSMHLNALGLDERKVSNFYFIGLFWIEFVSQF